MITKREVAEELTLQEFREKYGALVIFSPTPIKCHSCGERILQPQDKPEEKVVFINDDGTMVLCRDCFEKVKP